MMPLLIVTCHEMSFKIGVNMFNVYSSAFRPVKFDSISVSDRVVMKPTLLCVCVRPSGEV